MNQLFQLLAVETTNNQSAVLAIALAIITFLGICVSAFFGYKGSVSAKKAQQQSTETNKAVNGRPEGSPRLIDIVLDLQRDMSGVKEWHATWADLPENVASASRMSDWFDHTDSKMGELESRQRKMEHQLINTGKSIEIIRELLENHAKWEEELKYNELEKRIEELKEIIPTRTSRRKPV